MAHADTEQPSSAQNLTVPQESRGWMGCIFRRRWVRRTAVAVLALLVLFAAAHTLLTVYFGLRLWGTLAELRARGEPLEIRQACAGPPVRPHENAAPLYVAARALIEETTPYDYPPDSEKWDLTAARQGLERDLGALQLILTATQRPQCQFDVRWEEGSTSLLQYPAVKRQLARFVASAMIVAVETGEVEEAYRRAVAGFAMSRHAAMEPSLISQLVSYGVDAIMAGAVKVALAKAPPSRQTQQALLAAFTNRDFVAEYVHALRGERALGLDQFRRGLGCRLTRPWLYAEEFAYLHVTNSLIASAAQPFRPKDDPQPDRIVVSAPRFAPLTRMMLPTLARFKMERDKMLANRSLLQTAIALEVYRAEKGRYPETLALLRKEFPDVASEDVFSGKALVYRLEGDGFLLYSLGPDCRDDGGRPLDQREYPPRGDLVWIPHGKEDAFKARAAQAGPKKSAR